MALVAQIPTKTLPAYLDTFLYSLPLTAENADHNQRCLNNSELLTSLFPWFSRQEGGTIKLTRYVPHQIFLKFSAHASIQIFDLFDDIVPHPEDCRFQGSARFRYVLHHGAIYIVFLSHNLVLHCLYDNASSRLRLQQGRTEIPEIQTNNYI